MKPLPPNKEFGIVKQVRVTAQNKDDLAKSLGLNDHEKQRLVEGEHIHIVRETK
jgi:hypothetical protein